MVKAGLEPRTAKLRVRQADHSATLPPWHYWLTDRRTEQLTGKRTDQLTVRATDPLSDWLTGWFSVMGQHFIVDGAFILVLYLTGYVIRRGYLFIKIFCFPCAWFTLWWSWTLLFSQTGNRRQWVSLLSFLSAALTSPERGEGEGEGGRETLMCKVRGLSSYLLGV